MVWGGTNGEIIDVLPFEKNSGKMLGCLSSFPHIQFFFVLVLITRSSRERKFDSSDEVRQYVWVLRAGKHNEFSTMLVLDSNLFLMT